ncbi:MAG: ATP-binding cassette domain-containing protein [Sphingomonadales bacterium]|nr:MAG: ATP-binding cassette domain-containing protein [Sphingomonadales bacterium]
MRTDFAVPSQIRQAFAACRQHFVAAAAFSALVNILYLAPTIYMMQVYDRVVPTGGVLTLFWITVIVALAIACLSALDMVRSRLMLRASLRLNRQLAAPILDRLLARAKGNADPAAAQAMRDFDSFRNVVASPSAIALFDLPWTPLYFVVAFIIHPVLGLLIFGAGVVLLTLALLNERATKKSAAAGHQAMAAAYAKQESMFEKAEIVRALGMRRALVARQIADRREGLEASANTQLTAARYTGLVKFARMFLQSLALGVGAWLAINAEISVGAIIAASVLLARALQPIEQIVQAWPTIGQARRAKASIEALFRSTDNLVGDRVALPEPEGYVELSNVSLRTPDNSALILRGVSTWLIPPGTIGENISRFAAARGEHAVDIDDKVTRAAIAAGIHDLILHLPGGYNAQIGDGGLRLSGGQAQRIALARALYGDPKVLILDEPNAALDSQGEEALNHAIVAAKLRQAAIMIVTHRQSALRDADRLAVLKNGVIEHQGPRAEVMELLRESAAAAANVIKMTRNKKP